MLQRMPAGRPSVFNEEVQELADKYVDDFKDYGSVVPSIEGLALLIGVRRETLHAWDKDPEKEEFSNTLERLRARQKQVVIDRSLVGEYNATIAKMLLNVNHGMVEKSSKEVTGPDGGPLQVAEVRRIIVDP